MAGPITTGAARRMMAKKVMPKRPVAAKQAAPTAPAAPPPPKKSKETKKGYRATRQPIYHSYQNTLVPKDRGIPLIRDNWVEVQLSAGVIEEVEL